MAINDAIGHAGTLYDLMGAASNKDDRLGGAIVSQVSRDLGSPDITDIESASSATADELMRYLRRGADPKELEAIRGRLLHPEQGQGALSDVALMLQSRADALHQSYKSATGEDLSSLLSPKSHAIMRKFKTLLPGQDKVTQKEIDEARINAELAAKEGARVRGIGIKDN